MGTSTWGLLCPDGHGTLTEKDEWTAKGIAWCASSAHSANGRFYPVQEVKTGAYRPDGQAPVIDAETAAKLAVAREQRKEAELAKKAAAQAAVAEPKERAPRKAKEPKECKCGCGGMTKGGTFLPGHDARYHSALAKAQAAEAAAAEEAAEPEAAEAF